MKKPSLNLLLFVLLAFLWGGSYVAIKIVLQYLPPFFSAMLRMGLAASLIGGLIWVKKYNIRTSRTTIAKISLAGLFLLGFPMAFLFWGQRLVEPGMAGVINGTTAIWTFMLSIFFLPSLEQRSWRRIIGLVVALSGVIIVFSPMLMVSVHATQLPGAIAILMMAVSYAIGGVLSRKILSSGHGVHIFANLMIQMSASFLFLLALSMMIERWDFSWQIFLDPSLCIALCYMVIFSTALAWYIYFRLLEDRGAVRTSAVTYLLPVTGFVWDYAINGNIPGESALLGTAIITCGLILIQRK